MQRTLPCTEIDREEGDFVGYVDPAKSGFVLQAVKGDEPSAETYHVAAVQVAVTLTDTAVRPTGGHRLRSERQAFLVRGYAAR